MERKELKKWLADNERTLYWLSHKTGINYNTLYSWLEKESFNLGADKIKKISKIVKPASYA